MNQGGDHIARGSPHWVELGATRCKPLSAAECGTPLTLLFLPILQAHYRRIIPKRLRAVSWGRKRGSKAKSWVEVAAIRVSPQNSGCASSTPKMNCNALQYARGCQTHSLREARWVDDMLGTCQGRLLLGAVQPRPALPLFDLPLALLDIPQCALTQNSGKRIAQ
jgi:hypothetical protein